MRSAMRNGGVSRLIRNGILCALAVGCFAPAVLASSPAETRLSHEALVKMELQADQAQVREQLYLYSEVLHGLVELAGTQVTEGRDDEAAATMKQVDVVSTKLKRASAVNSKHLKDAELLLEHTTHRLFDLVRSITFSDRDSAQATLKRVNVLHSEVLGLVFAH